MPAVQPPPMEGMDLRQQLHWWGDHVPQSQLQDLVCIMARASLTGDLPEGRHEGTPLFQKLPFEPPFRTQGEKSPIARELQAGAEVFEPVPYSESAPTPSPAPAPLAPSLASPSPSPTPSLSNKAPVTIGAGGAFRTVSKAPKEGTPAPANGTTGEEAPPTPTEVMEAVKAPSPGRAHARRSPDVVYFPPTRSITGTLIPPPKAMLAQQASRPKACYKMAVVRQVKHREASPADGRTTVMERPATPQPFETRSPTQSPAAIPPASPVVEMASPAPAPAKKMAKAEIVTEESLMEVNKLIKGGTQVNPEELDRMVGSILKEALGDNMATTA